MAKYRANPVIVDAFRIEQVIPSTAENVAGDPPTLVLQGGEHVKPAWDMLTRIKPVVGDYWVVQPDGYIYLNPKAVFESKYSPAIIRTVPNPEQLKKILEDPENDRRPIIINPDGSLTVGEGPFKLPPFNPPPTPNAVAPVPSTIVPSKS